MMSKKLIEPGSLANADFAKVEEAVMAQVKIDTSGELEWTTLDNIMFFSGDYRIIRRQEWFDLRHKSGPYGTFALIASPKTLADAKQAAEYHFAALQTHEQDTAPAATDTGLETVEHQYWRDQTQEWLPTGFPDRYRKDGFQVRELVTRSQAEELLAAKDEQLREINELLDAGQGDDDGAQILPDFEDGMSVLGKVEACLALLEDRRDTIEGFEADNAAKDARIKELDRCHEGTIDLCNRKTAQIEALEAKLEAAEQRAKVAERRLEEVKKQLASSRETRKHWQDAAFKKRDECDELRKEHALLETRFVEVDHDRRGFQADALSWKQAFAAQSYKLHAALRAGDERVREAVRRAAEELRS